MHWRWTGSHSGKGYGLIHERDRGPATLAHRAVWQALGGELPEDLHHDGCPHKDCVKPACLSPLTKAEHTEAHHPLPATCSAGHAYTDANTYWRTDRKGRRSRQCRRCKADRTARYKAERRPREG